MTAEEWRPVVGFPSYEVSSLGRLVSRKRRTPRVLDGTAGRKAYRVVCLSRDGQSPKIRPVHILVAEAFHGARPDGTQVRHLDGDNQNNAATNLAWGTASENIRDQVRHGVHRNVVKTHCPEQHPYDEANTKVNVTNGSRMCRACRAERSAARWRSRQPETAAS